MSATGIAIIAEPTEGLEIRVPASFGDCWCGCGRRAPIAKITSRRKGWVKNQPMRFIRGHHARVLWADPAYRTRQSEVHTGHKPSEETLARMSASLTGRALSAEHVAKISAALSAGERDPNADEGGTDKSTSDYLRLSYPNGGDDRYSAPAKKPDGGRSKSRRS